MDENRLREKLARIEALLAGATTPGERDAARGARDRLQERLHSQQSQAPPEEHRFSIEDPYSRMLFVALARRYGLAPYRRHRQHRRTVNVKAPAPFVRDVLFPEFRELADALHEDLLRETQALIARAVHGDTTEATETEEPAGLLPGRT
ncbi:MAG: hypothetical protein HY904_25595 [Deltaproteobacteria bacterium]|nr:hypothetical protein [Deltaproteobacteria bacterium]